jgi:hypothetical protein
LPNVAEVQAKPASNLTQIKIKKRSRFSTIYDIFRWFILLIKKK